MDELVFAFIKLVSIYIADLKAPSDTYLGWLMHMPIDYPVNNFVESRH